MVYKKRFPKQDILEGISENADWYPLYSKSPTKTPKKRDLLPESSTTPIKTKPLPPKNKTTGRKPLPKTPDKEEESADLSVVSVVDEILKEDTEGQPVTEAGVEEKVEKKEEIGEEKQPSENPEQNSAPENKAVANKSPKVALAGQSKQLVADDEKVKSEKTAEVKQPPKKTEQNSVPRKRIVRKPKNKPLKSNDNQNDKDSLESDSKEVGFSREVMEAEIIGRSKEDAQNDFDKKRKEIDKKYERIKALKKKKASGVRLSGNENRELLQLNFKYVSEPIDVNAMSSLLICCDE